MRLVPAAVATIVGQGDSIGSGERRRGIRKVGIQIHGRDGRTAGTAHAAVQDRNLVGEHAVLEIGEVHVSVAVHVACQTRGGSVHRVSGVGLRHVDAVAGVHGQPVEQGSDALHHLDLVVVARIKDEEVAVRNLWIDDDVLLQAGHIGIGREGVEIREEEGALR